MSNEKFSFYKEHPKTCHPEDFWGQVKRTVNGVPVTQDQIDMIVDTVVKQLELTPDDILLDLCCGNGALSSQFFKYCKAGVGVDFSEYLISIANKNFASPPDQIYHLQDAVEFCENPMGSDRFTKMVCYGSFSYIEKNRAEKLLSLLNVNFPKLERIFIGNCPDKNLISNFLGDQNFLPGYEDDADTPIGVWRTIDEFILLANSCGWQARVHKMPATYYAAHYRYDVILSR